MSIYSKSLFYAACAGVLLCAGIWFGASHSAGPRAAGPPAAGERKILYYVDPMNPLHRSPVPCKAPCGMDMVPVYADESGGAAPATASAVQPVGTVVISSKQQELLDIHVGTVQAKSEPHTIRLLGRVAVQEKRLYRVVANVNGMIMTIGSYAPGSQVRKDDPMATIYSPEFTSPIQSLLVSVAAQARNEDAAKQGSPPANSINYYGFNLQVNIGNLRFLGFGENQINELVRTRALANNIEIVAPADAVIANWNISPGLRFEKGTELVRLEDLSKVWIVADVFSNEADYIQKDMPVRVTVASSKQTLPAKISELIPQFDGVSRALKVRMEVDNPDLVLKPDMFVDVEMSASLRAGAVVPTDAVLDTGDKQTVYVAASNGGFKPHTVKKGRQLGGQVEILEGLEAGDQIVLSANFLLDSESRIKQSANGGGAKMMARAAVETDLKDPVCGMSIERKPDAKADLQSTYERETYYFCGELCKQKFDKDPHRYSRKANTEHDLVTGVQATSGASNN